MKRLLQFVVVTVVMVLVPMAVTVPTFAQSAPGCDISETGPESDNECAVEETYTCTIDNDNNVTIINSNEQTAGSGSANVGENGTGGAAISGSATNGNDVTFNVVIDNSSEAPCVIASVTPTPETPETPETPVQPTQAATPTALPVTSGRSATIVLVSVGGIAVLAGLAVVYRQLHL